MRDAVAYSGLFFLGACAGPAVGRVLRSVLARGVLYLIFGWLGWMVALWAFGKLPITWQVLIVLSVILADLIRITGTDSVNGYAPRVPVTLAGPVQPWQTGEPA